MTGRSLAVTIVNHNHGDWILSCLASLGKHPYTSGSFEIIVLDNASEDGSVDAVQKRFPSVKLLKRKERRGFGANQNDAIMSCRTDLVYVLNPDAVVHSNTLDQLASAFSADESIAIAAGPDTGSDQSLSIDGPYPYPTPTSAIRRILRRNREVTHELLDENGLIADGWVSGHAFMVDRTRFEEIGGFDTDYFMYSEETDLMHRMQEYGWRIAWVDDAITTHAGKTSDVTNTGLSQGPPAIPDCTTIQFARSEIRFIRRNHGSLGTAVFRCASALDALVRYLATWIPVTRSLVVPKGPTIESTRHHHLLRMKTYLGMAVGPDMQTRANAWNDRSEQES